MLSENSELVIFSYHPYYSTHLVIYQHMVLDESQYQQFSRMLAGKGISIRTIMKFIEMSVGYIPLWHYYISEFLFSIVFAINNAEKILAIGNIYNTLPAIIGQALMMSVC